MTDPEEATQSSEEKGREFTPGQTVLLNALMELNEDDYLILDESSKQILSEHVDSVSTEEERALIWDEFDEFADLETGDFVEISPELFRFLSDVTDSLAQASCEISVTHEYQQELSPVNAHIYSLIQSQDLQRLRQLDISSAVETALIDGVEQTNADAKDEALAAFSAAMDSATTPLEETVVKSVAGWGHFQLEEDETALELVEEVLDEDEDAWVANIIGASIDKNTDGSIRAGKSSVGLFLRWSADSPRNSSVKAEVGDAQEGNDITWETVQHYDGHGFVDRVYPDTALRFTLHGELPDFPTLHGYYLGIGLYGHEINYIEDVYIQLGQGPNRQDTVESISIEEPG